jgi:hypothetical protein
VARPADQHDPSPHGPDPEAGGTGRHRPPRVRGGRGRLRRLLRNRVFQGLLALLAAAFAWAGFSIGQAMTAPGAGSASSVLSEWVRDHHLGPAVTFGEWLTYNPPQVGGKPGFSLAVPSGSALSPRAPATHAAAAGFRPDIPARLPSPAGKPLAGEGAWRVLETVNRHPAVLGTYLRTDRVHTSYVAGIASLDQRLVRFQLRPGAMDPGPGHWKAQPYVAPGTRSGLLATFNGGFKLDAAGGGFYLNGATRGTLTPGAASVVYHRDGTISVGAWGTGTTRMTRDVTGVRQNLRLIVDHGHVPAAVNQNVLTNWGATLGGGYYVWRSGLGVTRDGRVVFAYGPALDVRALAGLLQRAGAVEAMQLDINPYWMSFEYYQAHGHPSDPRPANLLPTQQQSAYRYYSVYSRDFTAAYAR